MMELEIHQTVLDMDIGNHAVYFTPVLVEYERVEAEPDIGINSGILIHDIKTLKGRSLPHIWDRMTYDQKVFLEEEVSHQLGL